MCVGGEGDDRGEVAAVDANPNGGGGGGGTSPTSRCSDRGRLEFLEC